MAETRIPLPTPETAEFWAAASRGVLSTKRCTRCGRAHFYPRLVCPHCSSTDLKWVELSGRGTLLSYVINHRPIPAVPGGGTEVIAIVQLEEGPRMMTNIVDVAPEPAALRLDDPVEVKFVQRGDVWLPMFRLTLE